MFIYLCKCSCTPIIVKVILLRSNLFFDSFSDLSAYLISNVVYFSSRLYTRNFLPTYVLCSSMLWYIHIKGSSILSEWF